MSRSSRLSGLAPEASDKEVGTRRKKRRPLGSGLRSKECRLRRNGWMRCPTFFGQRLRIRGGPCTGSVVFAPGWGRLARVVAQRRWKSHRIHNHENTTGFKLRLSRGTCRTVEATAPRLRSNTPRRNPLVVLLTCHLVSMLGLHARQQHTVRSRFIGKLIPQGPNQLNRLESKVPPTGSLVFSPTSPT